MVTDILKSELEMHKTLALHLSIKRFERFDEAKVRVYNSDVIQYVEANPQDSLYLLQFIKTELKYLKYGSKRYNFETRQLAFILLGAMVRSFSVNIKTPNSLQN